MLEMTTARNMAATARKMEIAVVLFRTMMSANKKNLRGKSTQQLMDMKHWHFSRQRRCCNLPQ